MPKPSARQFTFTFTQPEPEPGPEPEPAPQLDRSRGRSRSRFFVHAAGFLGFKFRAGLRDRLRHRAENQPDGTNRVIVGRNRIIRVIGIAVGVHQRHDGHADFLGLGHGVVLALDVHDEQRGGHPVQIADAIESISTAARLRGGWPLVPA